MPYSIIPVIKRKVRKALACSLSAVELPPEYLAINSEKFSDLSSQYNRERLSSLYNFLRKTKTKALPSKRITPFGTQKTVLSYKLHTTSRFRKTSHLTGTFTRS